MTCVFVYQRDHPFTVFGKMESVHSPNRPLLSTRFQMVLAAQNTQLVLGSQAQIFCHKHGQDLGQVEHGGAMHVLLRVIERVPELWEGGADEV